MNKKQQAGKAGGLATVQRHGREHMQPFGLNDFRIVNRETLQTVSYLSGKIFKLW